MVFRRHPSRPRRGAILMLLAVSMIGLIGVVAIAVEGGMLLDQRRRAQTAADSAAMAASVDLYENYGKYEGVDTPHTAKDSALATTSSLGYDNDGTRSKITVNIPPTNGPHAGKPGFVEVTVQYFHPRYFSRVFGAGDVPVKARAVGRGRWSTFKAGILVLDLHEPEALKANGGGTIAVVNADIIVNSNDPQSVAGDGNNTVLKVMLGKFKFSGGVKSGTVLDGEVEYNHQPTPDPLAQLTQPPLPTTVNTAQTLPTNSQTAKNYLDALNLKAKDVNKFYVLQPGRYDSLPNFGNRDVVILKQASANDEGGIYYLNNSGFTSTGATIVMDPTNATTGGLMLYNDPEGTSTGIKITGGKVLLEPMPTGKYAGLALFQNRDSDVAINIAGQGGMAFYGTFYAAGAAIKITGSNSSSVEVIGSQYISRTLQAGGNGAYNVDWSPQKTVKIRELSLVE